MRKELMVDSDKFSIKALEKVSSVYEEVYQESFKSLVNDDLLDLLEESPTAYKGLHLWFEVLLFSSASLSSSKWSWKSSKPIDVAKYFLATKYPEGEREKFWALLKERLHDLSEASQSGEPEDWMAFLYACLASYDTSRKAHVEFVVRRLDENKIIAIQGNVIKNFMKLWKKI